MFRVFPLGVCPFIMPKKKTLKYWKTKIDKVYHEYIRRRDCDDHTGYTNCITCDKVIHFDETDGGHFIGRQYMATRYDERNTYAQCRKCNRFEYGRQYEISKAIGAELSDELPQKSRQVYKLVDHEWQEIFETYKAKLQALKDKQAF